MKADLLPPSVRRWQLHRLGARDFGDHLSEFEVQHFFSFDLDDRRAIRSRRQPTGQLACGLHLGFLRMTGRTLDIHQVIPKTVLEHVGQQLDVPVPDITSLRALYSRKGTLYLHQRWVAQWSGFVHLSFGRRRALVRHLRREVSQFFEPNLLGQEARCWLYENKIFIPKQRTLDDIIRRVLSEEEQRVRKSIEVAIPSAVRERWCRALFRKRGKHDTVIRWLQRAPKKRSPATIDATLDKIEVLRELGVDGFELTGVSRSQQQQLATRFRRLRPSRARDLRPAQFAIALPCYLMIELCRLQDLLLDAIQLQGMAIFNGAKERVIAQRKITVDQAVTFYLHLEQTIDDPDVSDSDFRARVRELMPRIQRSRGLADEVREELSNNAHRTRRLVRVLLKAGVEVETSSPLREALDTIREVYEKDTAPSLPKSATADFAPRWKKQIECADRRRAMRAYEAATLQAVRTSLRTGAAYCRSSLKYRHRDELLIPAQEWASTKSRHYRRLRLPKTASRYLKPLRRELADGLEQLATSVDNGEVCIDKKGLHLQALEREKQPPRLEQTKRGLVDRLGVIELPDLIVEVDGLARFSQMLLGRAAHNERELLTLYGAIMALGMGRSATSMAMAVPQVSEDGLSSAMRLLEDERAVAAANDSVVQFMGQQAIAKHWGDGKMASSDAMSLEVSKHILNARIDPKSRKRSIGLYQHVSRDWAIVHHQPIPIGEREAGYAIDGLVSQSSKDIDALAVDTLGWTDFSMGVSRMLGGDLCPRLKNLRHRRLHVPQGMLVPDVLRPVVQHDLLYATISSGWDSMVRITASLESGYLRAPQLLRRYGAASRGDPTYEAGVQLGKLVRSIFLCDYCTNTKFRREILRVLNYGESLHELQRTLHARPVGPMRGRRHEEQLAISGSVALLSNVVMAGIAHRLQRELDCWPRSGGPPPTPEELRYISPAQYRIINTDGRYHFPVQQWASVLLSCVL